jgi:hypothetical protein
MAKFNCFAAKVITKVCVQEEIKEHRESEERFPSFFKKNLSSFLLLSKNLKD